MEPVVEVSRDHRFVALAAAFVRGRAQQGDPVLLPAALREMPLADLRDEERAAILQAGAAAGLRLHKFKQAMGLPRVRRVLGILTSLAPERLLDEGSGRGVFLWPLLDRFPDLPVTAVDLKPQRVSDLQAVRLGGVGRLSIARLDATRLGFTDASFDVVTLLEVLEHIPRAESALAEAVRVARRAVVLSVPSKEDDNPEHIHLFDRARLRAMFLGLGVRRVRFEQVRGHLIAIAHVRDR